jgi:hypothetical protein
MWTARMLFRENKEVGHSRIGENLTSTAEPQQQTRPSSSEKRSDQLHERPIFDESVGHCCPLDIDFPNVDVKQLVALATLAAKTNRAEEDSELYV